MSDGLVRFTFGAEGREMLTTPDTVAVLFREHSRLAAAQREREARALVVASLPRPLKRLVDHPRLLKLYYRLLPSKRPTTRVTH